MWVCVCAFPQDHARPDGDAAVDAWLLAGTLRVLQDLACCEASCLAAGSLRDAASLDKVAQPTFQRLDVPNLLSFPGLAQASATFSQAQHACSLLMKTPLGRKQGLELFSRHLDMHSDCVGVWHLLSHALSSDAVLTQLCSDTGGLSRFLDHHIALNDLWLSGWEGSLPPSNGIKAGEQEERTQASSYPPGSSVVFPKSPHPATLHASARGGSPYTSHTFRGTLLSVSAFAPLEIC